MSRVLQKINEALWLKSANAKRPGGRLNADTYRQWGRVKNWQNLADVFYGWPLANLS